MKFFFTILTFCLLTSLSFSQTPPNGYTKVVGTPQVLANSTLSVPSLANINKAKANLMSRLSSSLALTQAEKPTVNSAISAFLQNKASILPLINSDKASYQQQLQALQTDLFGKLQTILSPKQYSRLLAMKPYYPSPSNTLTNLYY